MLLCVDAFRLIRFYVAFFKDANQPNHSRTITVSTHRSLIDQTMHVRLFVFRKKNFSISIKLSPLKKAQKVVYEGLGTDILQNSIDGYNACIFAYGQTGRFKLLKTKNIAFK